MYNDQVDLRLVIRTPMGGKRGYGPTHSQSLEKHFLGLPGTRMLALHHRDDPGTDSMTRCSPRSTGLQSSSRTSSSTACETGRSGPRRLRSGADQRTLPDDPDPPARCTGPDDPLLRRDAGRRGEGRSTPLFDEVRDRLRGHLPNAACIRSTCGRSSNRSAGRAGCLMVEEGIGFAAFGAEVVARLIEAGARGCCAGSAA